jgi:hypothetical protein
MKNITFVLAILLLSFTSKKQTHSNTAITHLGGSSISFTNNVNIGVPLVEMTDDYQFQVWRYVYSGETVTANNLDPSPYWTVELSFNSPPPGGLFLHAYDGQGNEIGRTYVTQYCDITFNLPANSNYSVVLWAH